MVGLKIVLFFNKSPNDVIFLESKFTVSHGSSLTQSVVVQLPFSHFVDILVWYRVSDDDRMVLGNKTKIEQIIDTKITIAGVIILYIIKSRNFIFTSITIDETFKKNAKRCSENLLTKGKFFILFLRRIYTFKH